MSSQSLSADKYPELSKDINWEWGPIKARFELTDALPPEDKIANVRIVPFAGDRPVVVYMEHEGGHWDHPGGTLEPGETCVEAVVRELQEEAGAELLNFTPFGAFHCWSEAKKPYRPHLPFPEFYHVVGYADVELTGAPSNPADGETVSRVIATDLNDACGKLRTRPSQYWLAELYRLAAEVRASHLA